MPDKNALWSKAELQAAVSAYARLWREQQSGKDPAKAEMLSGLLHGPLSARTKGSIEYRMANISAVMVAAGKPFAQGYVPAKNVGPKNFAVIEQMLRTEGLLD